MKPLQFIKLVLLTLLLFVSNNNSFANPIVITEAGTLYSYIDATDKNSITDLTVTGYLNGDDILFLREMAGSDKNGGSTAGNLRTLDISGASIVAGGGLYFENPEVGYFETEDNVLGVAMFAMCDKLTSITLPATLSSANILAFAFCENLEAINVPASNTSLKSVDGVLFDYDMENLYSYPQKRSNTSYTVPVSVKSIRSYAFQGSKYLKSVVLPEGLETLEQGVFYYSEQLESINIPESITEIPDFFLGNCSKLSSITLPTGLTAIGSNAFASCVKLQIVTLPTTLKTIGSIAFADCIELRSLTLSPGLTTIGDGCFKNSGLESIAIPSTVTTIEDWAFWNCRQLMELKMYHNSDHIMPFNNNWMNIDYNIVLYVPEGSFYAYSNSDGWNNFSQIIEFEVEEEEEEEPYVEPMFVEIDVALAGTLYSYIDATDKNSITDLTVTGYLNGDDILFLREMAGSDKNGGSTAGNLRTLDISGASIVAGGGLYFENPEVGYFETEDNVLGVAMFAMCNKLTSITLPATLSSANILAFAFCENLEAINVPASNTSLKSVDGVLFDYDMENLYSYPQKRSNTSYTVPVSVKSIRSYAFQGSKYLKSVVLPEGLETLEQGVFYYSEQLESINIPESITEIPDFFLGNCSKLSSITLPTGLTAIGSNAFANTGITSIILPATINSLGQKIFTGTSLEKIQVLNTTPIIIHDKTFENIPQNSILIVPNGSVTAYQLAPVWNQFYNIIDVATSNQSLEANRTVVFTAKNAIVIKNAKKQTAVSIYSLTGTLIKTLITNTDYEVVELSAAGIYIVKIEGVGYKVMM